MDRVWEDMDPSWPANPPNPRTQSFSAWPRVNLYDGGSNLIVKADVAGLSEKDVHVTLNESGLSISGERKVAPPEGYSVHRQERSSFSFSRSLTLPCKVSPEQTQASVKNGVLTVTLAKAPEAQPRQIAVQAH
jgi:HSP20 family protein